jgi:hypothetical protein
VPATGPSTPSHIGGSAPARGAATELRSLGSAQTTEELEALTARLEAESAQLEVRLAPLRDGTAVVNADDRDASEKLALESFSLWSTRRKAFRELWDSVCEACDVAPKKLREDVPYDDDESAGADFAKAKDAVNKIKAARFKAGRR